MGVAVQKGAGQGILRGDGALGQIGGGQSGQQLHNGKAAARFGDRHAQQGRHLAERVWYGTGNGKGNTVPGFQCGAGGRRLQNNGIGLQGGIVADIIDGNGKTGVPQGLDGIGTVLAFQIRYGDGVWPFADGQYEFLPLFDGAARGGLLGDDDAFRLGRVAGIHTMESWAALCSTWACCQSMPDKSGTMTSRRMENMGLVLWDKMTVMAMPAATTESSARQARTRSGVRENEW